VDSPNRVGGFSRTARANSPKCAEPQRRDRMLLLSAFAITFLTLLGEAGEELGMDRLLKSDTARKRVHSLFPQGCMLYELIPGMPEHRLAPLVERFVERIHQRRTFQNALSNL
jgi:hypothetical protein